VTWFVLIVAVANVLLGYAAALSLVEPPLWSGWFPAIPRRRVAAPHDSTEDPGHEATVRQDTAEGGDVAESGQSLPAVAGIEELPTDWLAQLAAEGIVAQSFVEAAAHALRLEVSRYREQLVTAECRTRAVVLDGNSEELSRLASDLLYVNQDWLDKQTAAADMLTQRAGRMGDQEQAASALEQVLLDQAAQIRSVCTTLESLDAAAEVENRGKQLLEQIGSLLMCTHALRDRIVDLLAMLIREGKALDTYGPVVQRDAATGLPNRIGLETLLSGWWREDEQRTRVLSAIVVGIDRFGRVNQRLSARSGDRTILAVSQLIDETIVKDRGFERLARIGGESFIILQGDVGPHQALTAAERLRQSIEATTFHLDDTEFDLTVSCGVIEVGHAESSLDLVKRALEALQFAKRAGRNRCALDKGEGPVMLDPPQFPVKGRIINLHGGRVPGGGAAAPVAPAAAVSETEVVSEKLLSEAGS
jgi:diguanylate cyclase